MPTTLGPGSRRGIAAACELRGAAVDWLPDRPDRALSTLVTAFMLDARWCSTVNPVGPGSAGGWLAALPGPAPAADNASNSSRSRRRQSTTAGETELASPENCRKARAGTCRRCWAARRSRARAAFSTFKVFSGDRRNCCRCVSTTMPRISRLGLPSKKHFLGESCSPSLENSSCIRAPRLRQSRGWAGSPLAGGFGAPKKSSR